MDEIEIRTENKTVYIGHEGREYDSERLAAASFIKAKLAEIIRGDQPYYDFSAEDAADDLLDKADDVLRYFQMLKDLS